LSRSTASPSKMCSLSDIGILWGAPGASHIYSFADFMSLLNLWIRLADLAQLGLADSGGSPLLLYQGISFGCNLQHFLGLSLPESESVKESPPSDLPPPPDLKSLPRSFDKCSLLVSGLDSSASFPFLLGPILAVLISDIKSLND